MEIRETYCASILTRTSGYLREVCSHSLNPYVGCGYGNSSCGEGCYVRFNLWLLRGRQWGSFVDVKVNADKFTIKLFRQKGAGPREEGFLFPYSFLVPRILGNL